MGIEKIIIKENDDYIYGYRYIFNIKYLHFEKEDMFFNKYIDYKKVKEQVKDAKNREFLKRLNGFTNVVQTTYPEQVIVPAMDKLKRVKDKEELYKIINNFIDSVNRYNNKEKGNEYRLTCEIIRESLDKNPDLTICALIKHIVRLYYSSLLTNTSNAEINKMETCKIENYEDEEILDKLMEYEDEKNIDSDKAFYTYRKRVFNNLLSARFDNYRHHECGSVKACNMEQFKRCEKVHRDINKVDITQFPCVKKGIQVYTQNYEGKLVLDKFIVEKCDYKRSHEMVPKKLLFEKKEK